MKKKVITILVLGVVALTAITAFAGEYNSSISNSSTTLSIINKQVGNILLRYGVGGAEINKVTDTLAVGIDEVDLKSMLIEIGIGEEGVNEVFTKLDELGVAVSTPTVPTDTVTKPTTAVSGLAPTVVSTVKKCGVNTFRVSNECGIGAFKNVYFQCYDGYEEKQGGESSCKSSEIWAKYAREACVNRCAVVKEEPTPAPTQTIVPIEIDRCREVAQWENKIDYYKKLAGLSDVELKEQTGFLREEIEKILSDLPQGLEKVKAQCDDQQDIVKKRGMGTEILSMDLKSISEPIKPVVVESGQEIDDYYKAKIEKITAAADTEEQIQKLSSLKEEIDELITRLIKSRKEMEASELTSVVTEIKISKGEIKADDVVVKTTSKKILVTVGNKSISVEPTAKRVLIRDGGLEIEAKEISIKDNILRVGTAEVKLAASDVIETIRKRPGRTKYANITLERGVVLAEENGRAVYRIKETEPRKLFGFIPIRIIKTLTASAETSDLLDERFPWYTFLTTK